MLKIPTSSRWVQPALIAVTALLLRIFQLSGRSLYWDDLIIPSYFFADAIAPSIRSLQADPPSSTLDALFSVYDGHLMPGSATLQFLVFKISGLNWLLPAALITAATAVSLLLWWRVLRRIDFFALRCLAFAAVAFSPFLMTAAGWWSAAINAYTWQIACAGVLLFILNGKPWRAAIVLLIGLLFTEKSLSILPVVLWLMYIRSGRIKTALRGSAPAAAVTALWAGLFIWRYNATAEVIGTSDSSSNPAHELFGSIPQALAQAVAPGILGGAWRWSRWHPGPAFTQPETWMSIGAAVLVLAGLAWLLWYSARSKHLRPLLTALLGSLGYLALIFAMLIVARSGEQTSDVLLRNLHYYADWFTASALFFAAAFPTTSTTVSNATASAVATSASTNEMTRGEKILASATVLFVVSASITTASWRHAWADDPTPEYLTNLTASLNRNGEYLDQDAPLEILTPVVYPFNQLSSITGHSPQRSTQVPQIIDSDGIRTAGAVIPLAENVLEDPEPQCGMRVAASEARWANLNNPLQFGQWTWQFHVAATSPVDVRISAPNGLEDPADTARKAVTLHVGTELSTHYVRIDGGGGTLLVEVLGDEGQSICVGSGSIGPFVSTLAAQRWAKQ